MALAILLMLLATRLVEGCPAIPVVAGKSPDCGLSDNGDVCSQSCDPGYVQTGGSTFLFCQQGAWVPNTPLECEPECPEVPAPTNGSVVCPATTDTSATCEQNCDSGFRLLGDVVRACTDGAWEGTVVSCVAECPEVAAPAFGSPTCSATITVNEVCAQTCIGGYAKSAGTSSRRCGFDSPGVWEGSDVECLPECPEVPPPEHGSVTCPATTDTGSTCEQLCDGDYLLLGSVSRPCSGGVWSGTAVTCVRCPFIAAPSGGSPDCPASKTNGEVCNQVCDSGYAHTSGDAVRTCTDGVWDGADVVCTPECPEVPAPGNGSVTCPATIVNGEACNQLCDTPKYQLFGGDAIRTCGAGTWSGGDVVCRPFCPTVLAPAGGSVTCPGTFVEGTTCEQVCDPGMRITGSTSRTCVDGSWTGSDLTCTPECPHVPAPVDGSGDCPATIVDGTFCNQACNSGFTQLGDLARECTTGVWTGTAVTCVQCPLVPSPPHGGPDCPATGTNGDTCEQVCDLGHTQSAGDLVRTCSNGNWSGSNVYCEPECPYVGPPVNGNGECLPTVVSGTVCTQACNGGYAVVSGDTDLTCTSGSWDGVGITCVLECPSNPAPLFGSVLSGTCGATTIEGEECCHTCDSGYQLLGDSCHTCTAGAWDRTPTTCVQCRYVPPPEFGSPGCPATDDNDAWCNQTCNAFHAKTVGSDTRRCQNGVWTGLSVSCYPECPLVPAPGNGSVTCAATTDETTWCNQTCHVPKYQVFSGSETRICTFGVWPGDDVVCKPQCPHVPKPANGFVECNATFVEGTTCDQHCEGGHLLTGSPARTCVDGAWTGADVVCTPQCPFVPAPSDGTGDCPQTTVEGAICTPTCNFNYQLLGDSPRVCTDGNWTGVEPTCVQCPEIPSPSNGGPTCGASGVNESTCTQTCNTWYAQTDGDAVRTCINGVWTGEGVVCTPQCPDFPRPTNGWRSNCGVTTQAGRQCTQGCNNWYGRTGGSYTHFCVDGNWTNPPLTCGPQCSAQSAPANGNTACPSTVDNSTVCCQTCAAGYQSIGDSCRSCGDGTQQGNWTGVPLRCVRCPYLPPPLNGGPACAATPDNTAWCNQTCDYWHAWSAGTLDRRCSNGNWLGTDLECLPECPTVPAPANGAVQCDNTIEVTGGASVCAQVCNEPEYAVHTGDILRRCVDGNWTGNNVECYRQCADVPIPRNGTVFCNKTTNDGTLCEQACDPGNLLTGDVSRTCFNGTWSGEDVVCTPLCPYVGPPGNGSVECNATTNTSATCEQQCDDTYRPRGAITRPCWDGQWLGTPVTCVRCPAIPAPEHGRDFCNHTDVIGATCVQTCDNWYGRFSGDELRTCQEDGTWTGSNVVCHPECPPLGVDGNASILLAAPMDGNLYGSPEGPWGGVMANSYYAAFDGDTSTYFDNLNPGTGYTGMDLGEAKRVRQIRYYPRSAGTASRMVGGVFEGSNVGPNSGFVPIYTIPSTPASGVFTTVTLTTISPAYRWVRYTGGPSSFCNVAEIEFIPARDDCSSTIVPGTLCQINCNPWYALSAGNSTRECIDGNWTGKDLQCLPECPAVPAPSNGVGDCPNTIVEGQTCEATCKPEYQWLNSANRTCTNGNWTGDPLLCVRCEQVDAPEGGTPVCPANSDNSAYCNQTCNFWWRQVAGNSTRKCTNGTWEGQNVTCLPECPFVAAPGNGTVDCPKTVEVTGSASRCRQLCDEPYFSKASGTNTRRCEDGNWTGQPIKCLPQCLEVPIPRNGSVLCPTTIVAGTTCEQVCDPGNQFNGSVVRTCYEGNWTGERVVCTPLCPHVPAPPNGSVPCSATTNTSETCDQLCDFNWKLLGAASRPCFDGKWLGDAAYCVQCPAIPPPANGSVPCAATGFDGDTCEQVCNPWFLRTAGTAVRTCTDGVWSGSQPVCTPECPYVPIPGNGSIDCAATVDTSAHCNQVCKPWFAKSAGDSIRQCYDGNWTGAAVECLPECPFVAPPGNGSVSCAATINAGQTCTQQCDFGFRRVGDPHLTCYEGNWTGDFVECVPECPLVPAPGNGTVECPATTNQSATCAQKCNTWYLNVGNVDVRRCYDGNWTGGKATCLPECPRVEAPRRGGVICESTVDTTATCEQTCFVGHRLSGRRVRQCTNGNWTGGTVVCTPECPDVTQPPNGFGVCPNTTNTSALCSQSCNVSYVQLGTLVRPCTDGKWVGPKVECVLECPEVLAPLHGGPTCPATLLNGEICEQTCPWGFRATGDIVRTCEATYGRWSGTSVQCHPECPLVRAPRNGNPACPATIADGETCEQTCNDGYLFMGSPVRECQGGAWTGTAVTCTRCGDYGTCTDCIKGDPNCGWCSSSGTCTHGNATDASRNMCPGGGWIFPESAITDTVVEAGFAIVPKEYSVELRAGAPLYLAVDFHILRVPLDLYLLQDLSSSFVDDLDVLQALAPTLLPELRDRITNDTLFGVGSFIDKPYLYWGINGDYTFQHHLSMTNSTDDVVDTLNSLFTTVGRGVDLPESQLEALLHATTCSTTVGWRPEARHVILLSTDAWYHMRGEGVSNYMYENAGNTAEAMLQNDGDCSTGPYEDYPSVWQVKRALEEYNVVPVFALAAVGEDLTPQYDGLLDVLGFGSSVALEYDSRNLIEAIQNGYEEASKRVLLKTINDPHGYMTDVWPAGGYVNAKIGDIRSFMLTVEWDGAASALPGDVDLTALGFGSMKVSVDLITTCNCSGVTCPGPDGNCTGGGSCDCGKCFCDLPWSGERCDCDLSLDCSENSFCGGNGDCVCGTCECDVGWKGPACNCSEAPCLASCVMPRGTCECGVCTCEPGYSGEDCSCSDEPCDAGCTSPQGSCVCGECACAAGWGGPACNCSTDLCPGLCSGHGNCTCGACECEDGWEGDDCSCTTDPCADPTCGGHGSCVCGVCQCAILYTGDNCTCFDIPCLNNCNPPNGVCECNTCLCAEGFSGPDCSCDDSAPCPNNCSDPSKGTCRCGDCQCEDGWTGDDCSCSITCPNGCSGRAENCTCGVCTCLPGWTGDDCSCLDVPCPHNCSYPEGGECVCGGCICNEGFATPSSGCNCSLAPCENDCNGNGACVCGECQCLPGFAPPDCACALSECVDDCSGHGECTPCGCVCDVFWAGDDCACSTLPCPNNCTAPNGACVCGDCQCVPPWTGVDCSCNSTAVCPSSANGTDCHAHGTCDGCGVCTCEEDFAPPDCSCSTLPCPNNCTEEEGQGHCVCGVCECEDPFTGDDCSCDPVMPCSPTCGDHGTCVCGACVCHSGWVDGASPCSICVPNENQTCSTNRIDACPGNGECGRCVDAGCTWCNKYSKCFSAPPGDCESANDCAVITDSPTFIGAVVLGLLLCMGCLIFAVIKAFQWWRYQQDLATFEAEKIAFEMDSRASPLFIPAGRERENPLFGEDQETLR